MRPWIDQTALIGKPPESSDWPWDMEGKYPSVAGSARIEAYAHVDAGTEVPTRIGERTWLLKGVHVGHDAEVGDDCVIATYAIVGGHAIIGDRVHIGLGAIILPFRVVHDDAVIGAGAVVTRDVPKGAVVAGNPARVLGDHERDPRPHSLRSG